MTDWYDDWKKKSEAYKPNEPDQGVLWMKQMALMSPHFKELRDRENKISVNEHWMNAFGQMCYDMGTQRIDDRSYEMGYAKARKDIADLLGFSEED